VVNIEATEEGWKVADLAATPEEDKEAQDQPAADALSPEA
jgi:hypothetical protein